MAKGIDSSLFEKVKARSDSAIEKADSVISAASADAMALASETKAGEALADAQAKIAEINLDMADLGIPNPANLADLMPAPLANLQDKMAGIAAVAGDPAALMGQLDQLKSLMPDIDISAQLTTMGMDGSAIMSTLDKVNLGSASDLAGKAGSIAGDAMGKVEGAQALLGGAKADALKKITGLLPTGDALAGFDIENKIPNFEIGADGIMSKLGNPTEFLYNPIAGFDLKEMDLGIDTELLTPDKKMAFSGVAKTNVTIQDQGKQEKAVEARKKANAARKALQEESDEIFMETIEAFGAPMRVRSAEKAEKLQAVGGSHYGWRWYQIYAKKSIELEYQHDLFEAGVNENDVDKLQVAEYTLRGMTTAMGGGRAFAPSVNDSMWAKITALSYIEIV